MCLIFMHSLPFCASSLIEAAESEILHEVKVSTQVHEGGILSATLSRDGTIVVSVGALDGSAFVWNTALMKAPWSLDTHEGKALACAVSPDNRRVALSTQAKAADNGQTTEYGRVTVFDVASKSRVWTQRFESAAVTTMVFGHDGKTLTVGDKSGAVQILDAFSGKCDAKQSVCDEAIEAIELVPSGRYVATMDLRGNIRLTEVATLQSVTLLELRTGPPFSLVCSPDGKTLAAAGFHTAVAILNLETREKVGTVRNSMVRAPSSMVWDNQKQQVIVSDMSGKIRICDLKALDLKTSLMIERHVISDRLPHAEKIEEVGISSIRMLRPDMLAIVGTCTLKPADGASGTKLRLWSAKLLLRR